MKALTADQISDIRDRLHVLGSFTRHGPLPEPTVDRLYMDALTLLRELDRQTNELRALAKKWFEAGEGPELFGGDPDRMAQANAHRRSAALDCSIALTDLIGDRR